MTIVTRLSRHRYTVGGLRGLIAAIAASVTMVAHATEYCVTWSMHGGGMSSSGTQCFPDENTCKAAVVKATTQLGETTGSCMPRASGATTNGSATGDPNAMMTQGLANSMAGAMTNDPTRFGSGLGQLGAGLILDSLFGGPSPEEQAREAQLAEQQRRDAEQRAQVEREIEARRLEEQKQRVLGALKGLDAESEQTKPDSGVLVGGQTNFFGIGTGTGLQLKPVQDNDPVNRITDAIAGSPVTSAGISSGAADKAPVVNPGSTGPVSLGGMPLKGLDSPAPLPTDPAPVLALNQTVALIPRNGDPEHLAKGQRIVDCKATRQFYDRLAKGMPVQREWLEHMQEQLFEARRERHEQREETSKMLREDTIDTLKDLMWQSDVLRAELNGLNQTGMSLDKRKALAHAVREVSEIYDGAVLGKKTVEAGEPYAEALIGSKPETYGDYNTGKLIAKPTSLEDKTKALLKFLSDSGLLEEEGKNLSEHLGPEAVMLFTIAKLDIDVWSNAYGEHITDTQLEDIKRNESTLREQIDQIDGRLQEASQDLNQYCSH